MTIHALSIAWLILELSMDGAAKNRKEFQQTRVKGVYWQYVFDQPGIKYDAAADHREILQQTMIEVC